LCSTVTEACLRLHVVWEGSGLFLLNTRTTNTYYCLLPKKKKKKNRRPPLPKENIASVFIYCNFPPGFFFIDSFNSKVAND
jgi:hypothetical protein